MFNITKKNIILSVFIAIQSVGLVAEAKINSVTNQAYTDCASGGKTCFYTPTNISEDEMSEYLNIVRSEIGAVEGRRFVEAHHHVVGKETKVERASGDRVQFRSGSRKCTMGEEGDADYKTGIKCKDLIEYWLIKHDKAKLGSKKRSFVANIIIYEFNKRKETGFKLGFNGMLDEDTTQASRSGSLTNDSVVSNTKDGDSGFLQSLASVFSLDIKNASTGLLSLKLSLGNLGGNITTYKKFRPLEIRESKYFSSEPLKEVRFAKNITSSPDEDSKEKTGLVFSGEIEAIDGMPNRVLFKRGTLQYATATDGSSSAPDSFSLTRQINLNGHSSFELEVELNKPKLLFDLTTVELQKEKGAGLLFWNNVKVKKNINLMGVLFIEEVERKSDSKQGVSGRQSFAEMNIAKYLNEASLRVDYDPIVSAVKLNSPIDLDPKSANSRTDFDYKVKPYYMQLDASKLPDGYQQYLNSRIRIYTTPDSDVTFMGGGSASVTLKDLINKGLYFGVEPKNGVQIPINPLKFELVMSIDRESVRKKSNWSSQGVNNAAVFYLDHYIFDSSVYLESKNYGHIPWR